MWIIKIGGSLQDSEHLQSWLDAIVNHGGGRLVLVAGGGRFADRVRREQEQEGFDDRVAHERAVRAMERFAALVCEYSPRLVPAQSGGAIRGICRNNHVPVWLPGRMVIGNPELPASWTVTSDSLALWLCQRLAANGLLLVKSVAVDDLSCLEEHARAGRIDAYFADLFQKQPVRMEWFVPEQYPLLPELLDSL